MSLSLDAFKEASRPKRMVCSVSKVIATLSAKDRDALEAAMSDAGVTGAAIAQVLTDAGHPIKQASVMRHRRGQCTCSERAA